MGEAAMKSALFLQVIIHKEILSDYEMANESSLSFNDRDHLRHITELNQKLDPLNLAIQSGKDELTGEKFWAFVPTIRDEKMTFQLKFTQPQLDLLRTIFMNILNSDEGWISSIAAINLGSTLEIRISPTEVERTIAMMVESKWLTAKEGNIFIGARSIIELMPFLRDCHDGDFDICTMCNLSVFHGHRCDNCQTVTHLFCLARLQKELGKLDCFRCKHPLDIDANELPNIEELDASGLNQPEDDEAESPPARRVKGTKRRHC